MDSADVKSLSVVTDVTISAVRNTALMVVFAVQFTVYGFAVTSVPLMTQFKNFSSEDANLTEVASVNPVLLAGAASSTVYVPLAVVSKVIPNDASTFFLKFA
ncbi:MAG: hypothetical protein IJI54_05470 [Kiritimatiellae bacterium]|nr:hypothetical protein [Kiritimatiellia bacterium]